MSNFSPQKQNVTFITGNQDKADYLAKWLRIPIEHKKIDLDEIQSLDPYEVVEHKARQAYKIIKKPVLVEDVSLTLTELNKLPGPFIKWFHESLGLDGIVQLAHGLPDQTADALVCYGLYDGKDIKFFEGEMHGRIADHVSEGRNGFGFDVIFINDGFDKTRAEMTDTEYDQTSYRIPAIEKLQVYLNELVK